MYVCIHIYIYIEREREREREISVLLRAPVGIFSGPPIFALSRDPGKKTHK